MVFENDVRQPGCAESASYIQKSSQPLRCQHGGLKAASIPVLCSRNASSCSETVLGVSWHPGGPCCSRRRHRCCRVPFLAVNLPLQVGHGKAGNSLFRPDIFTSTSLNPPSLLPHMQEKTPAQKDRKRPSNGPASKDSVARRPQGGILWRRRRANQPPLGSAADVPVSRPRRSALRRFCSAVWGLFLPLTSTATCWSVSVNCRAFSASAATTWLVSSTGINYQLCRGCRRPNRLSQPPAPGTCGVAVV